MLAASQSDMAKRNRQSRHSLLVYWPKCLCWAKKMQEAGRMYNLSL